MQLVTKQHLEFFLRLGRQAGNPDPMVVVKLFAPWNSWTWYATEFDPNSGIFFGYVCGLENEWGYFSLPELERISGPYGFKIERDLYFQPTPFSQIKF